MNKFKRIIKDVEIRKLTLVLIFFLTLFFVTVSQSKEATIPFIQGSLPMACFNSTDIANTFRDAEKTTYRSVDTAVANHTLVVEYFRKNTVYLFIQDPSKSGITCLVYSIEMKTL